MRSFEELHALLEETIGDVQGIGELMVYDTALRIGDRLGVTPRFVYLHAGTRAGALALGQDASRKRLSPEELPATFRRLTPREIEDCLCIYKEAIARVSR